MGGSFAAYKFALACFTSHVSMFYLLVLQLHGTSITRAVAAVLRREGWRGLYSGVRAQLLGTG